ncbi:MAG: NAD-dependent malic enzyme, partial [Candidatus Moranbacteria bacterium]|nr:NAD-dependent malic enzyme [Candidatus Moranbacteria bacterium]
SIPVLHDDQHGTALVVLAGLINACKVTRKNLKQAYVVIAGAGAAGTAIAELLLLSGVGDITMLDSQGIIYRKRPGLDKEKQRLAQKTNTKQLTGGLAEALVGADVFIGVSKGNTVTEMNVASMAPRAIVFALANPVPEIMPDVAKRAGALVVATGRSDFANQINNSLGFPGIFRGALEHKVRKITDAMLIRAAKNLAALVKKPTSENIIPNTFDRAVVSAVARAIR